MKYVPSVVALILLLGTAAFAGEDSQVYSLAVHAAKGGQDDFAFMHYSSIVRNHPHSRFKEHALFSIGEYYFLNPNFFEAQKALNAFIKDYPNSKGKLFGLLLLYKIAGIQNDAAARATIKKDIIALKQVSFIFRKAKEYKYLSGLNRSYQAVFHIDRIEFFVQGELFEKITY